jgi:hypothetical protein
MKTVESIESKIQEVKKSLLEKKQAKTDRLALRAVHKKLKRLQRRRRVLKGIRPSAAVAAKEPKAAAPPKAENKPKSEKEPKEPAA